MSDYRYTVYEEKSNYKAQKIALESEIRAKSRYTNMKNAIDRNSDYKKKFQLAYDKKCCYCGASVDIVGIGNYEIDHITCESYCVEHDMEPHLMSNIAFSCNKCNLAKSNFIIYGDNHLLLSPDEKIDECFERMDNYGICIKDEYKEDNEVITFHEQLKLGNNAHRLDYLIQTLKGFSNTCHEARRREIGNLLFKLICIRNNLYYDLASVDES